MSLFTENGVNFLLQDFEKVTSLSPFFSGLIQKCCGKRVVDLIMHFPSSIRLRTQNLETVLSDHQHNMLNLAVKILDHIPPISKSSPYKILCSSVIGNVYIVYFHSNSGYLKKKFPLGELLAISGHVNTYDDIIQIVHPDKIGPANQLAKWEGLESIYPLIAKLPNSVLKSTIQYLLRRMPEIDEWIPNDILQNNQWKSFRQTLIDIHCPQSANDLLATSSPRSRIAFDEILANQICLSIVRKKVKSEKSPVIKQDNHFLQHLNIPFKLTDAQNQVLEDILSDLSSDAPMNRLLQGEVGSGKTIVAFIAMFSAVSSGYQAVFIAPTEILAQQHFQKISNYAQSLGLQVDLIISKNFNMRKKQINDLENNITNIAIGTHALLEENIKFANLGLAVIDEQQRFGVLQRLKLIEKGHGVNALYLSATPIPRTLVLSMLGDLDVSTIRHRPSGTSPNIETALISYKRVDELVERLNSYPHQIYWVCPLIEASEAIKSIDVTSRYQQLANTLSGVGILHGKMDAQEKEDVLNKFKNREIKILVSTTVIEVGIDIHSANMIIIENAERFGLSQLHQLRGRVGRGGEEAFCILIYGQNASKEAIEKLKILKKSQDGFEISEFDMKLRGYGDILGTLQSGFMSFKFSDLSVHEDLLKLANKNASLLLENNRIGTENLLKIYNRNLDLKLM